MARPFTTVISCLVLMCVAGVGRPRASAQKEAMTVRPPLQAHQGRYFRWVSPVGWKNEESTNGVTTTAPNGTTLATSALLLRSPGSSAPQTFLPVVLRMVGARNVKVLSAREQSEVREPQTGMAWKIQESDVSCTTAEGRIVRARYTVGIVNRYGMSYDAVVVGFQTPPAEFDASALWLSRIAQSITIVNAAGVAGNDKLIPVKNHPLDNSGLIESWRQKGLSEDRISKAQREGMSGYERTKDRATGQIYEMPLEAWNAARGGYVNPVRPTELLDRTKPGE